MGPKASKHGAGETRAAPLELAERRPGRSWGYIFVCLTSVTLLEVACSSEGKPGDGDGDRGDGDSASGGGDGDSASGGDAGGDGDAAGSGGQTGDGDAPLPGVTFVLSESGGVYTYSVDDSSMRIDPQDGGRVTSFIVGGFETLVQEGAASQHGSVFWPSPQSLWDWPPPPAIDEGAYSASVSGDELSLVSAQSSPLDLIVTKKYVPTTTPGGEPAIAITYTMLNAGDSTLDVAAWEISRVASGMAFYPTGPGGQLPSSTLSVTTSGEHTWYVYDSTGLMDVPKSLGDGKDGWLAWSTDNALVVKSFNDIAVSSFASGEAEIEIYADPEGDYMEVEQQGPITSIAPGASSSWTVVWTGVVIPGGTDTSLGSSALVNLVTSSR